MSLKRNTPMPRGEGPKRKARLKSRSPQGQGAGLSRTARLRPVSEKRQAENRQRRKMVAQLFPERPLCVVYELYQDNPGLVPGEVISACGRWADDVHEPLTRARGGSISDPENAVPPCRSCHGALGLEPSWGYALGLLVHSWDAPAKGGEAA